MRVPVFLAGSSLRLHVSLNALAGSASQQTASLAGGLTSAQYLTDSLVPSPTRPLHLKLCQTMDERGEELPDKAEILREFVREVSVISMMHHPNVIQFVGSCLTPPR